MSTTTHGAEAFWQLADYFRARAPSWILTAKYELRESVEIAGNKWTMCLSILALGEPPTGGEPEVRFEADIRLWPPPLTTKQESALARLGWYKLTRGRLAERGYSGSWRRAPSGAQARWAGFTMDLSDVESAQREAEWFARRVEQWRSGCALADFWRGD